MRPAAALFMVLALAGLAVAGPGHWTGALAEEGAGAGTSAVAPRVPGGGAAAPAAPGDQAADPDLAATWTHAQVYLRYEDEELNLRVISGEYDQAYIQKFLALHAQDPMPVAIYLHGCARSDDLADLRNQGRALAEMGFVVVMPNSFARRNRPTSCDMQTQHRQLDAPFALIQRWRLEELGYALKQVLSAPWADKTKLFVAGFDEGGDAALAFADPALAGRFAIGAPCRFPPLPAPKLPTLVITAERDLWFDSRHEPEAQGRCRRLMRGQTNVAFFEPEGVLHDALIYEEARVALWDFLVRASFL